MTSRTTAQFRKALAELPVPVQEQSRHAYRMFQQNPQHPSLRFRQVHQTLPVYSVRVGLHCRAVGVRDSEEIVWFWIGPHAEYDHVLTQL